MHRFFVNPALLKPNTEIRLEGELAHQLVRVLRLNIGDYVILLDGKGSQYTARLSEFGRLGKTEFVLANVADAQLADGEPALKITLYQALLKGEKFDWVLQKGTEVGISRFVPLLTERCITPNTRPERWQKIIQEAAEQSRRAIVPELANPAVPLAEALRQLKAANTPAVLLWENETGRTLRQLPPDTTELAIIVGPEGGFTDSEVALANAGGILSVTLGKRILRAETAGLVASAIALYQLGAM